MVRSFAYGDGFAGVSNRANPSAIYIKGDEFTDGSLRIIPSERGQSGKFDLAVRERENGVWNNTGIQVSASSIQLGLDLSVAAAGRYIRTIDVVSSIDSVAPHHEFTDLGSDAQGHTPIFGPLAVKLPIGIDESSEVISTKITSGVPAVQNSLVSRLYVKTGSVVATAPVTLTFHRGATEADPVFFQRTLPTSLFGTTETEIEIEADGLIEVVAFEPILGVFESEQLFSLKSDALGSLFFSVDVRNFSDEDILTDSFILTNDLAIVFDNSGDLLRNKHTFN